MATVFRDPLIQQGKHPARQGYLNSETSQGIPKPITLVGTIPTKNPAGVGPQHPSKNYYLNPNTSQGINSALRPTSTPPPIFGNTNTSTIPIQLRIQDTSNTITTGIRPVVTAVPFTTDLHLQNVQRYPWKLNDTSQGLAKVNLQDEQIAIYYPECQTVIRRPQIPVFQSTISSFALRNQTTIVGTGAATNANDTSSAQGTTTIIGTSSYTNVNDTSTASGSGGSGVLGTASPTNANDTSSASGTTTVLGTSSNQNNNDTSSASGTTTVLGTSSASNNNDVSSASGFVGNPPSVTTRLPLTGMGA